MENSIAIFTTVIGLLSTILFTMAMFLLKHIFKKFDQVFEKIDSIERELNMHKSDESGERRHVTIYERKKWNAHVEKPHTGVAMK